MLVIFSFPSCSFSGMNLGEAVLMTEGSKKNERHGNTYAACCWIQFVCYQIFCVIKSILYNVI